MPDQSRSADAASGVVAPFVVDRIVFSDVFQAFVGGRFDRIRYDDPVTSTSRAFDELSPMAGVALNPAEDLTLYASAGKAFAPPSSLIAGPRDVESATQFEAGAKKYLVDNRLHASVAVFDLRKYGIGIPDETGVTKQDGDQRSRGLELEDDGASRRRLPRLSDVRVFQRGTDALYGNVGRTHAHRDAVPAPGPVRQQTGLLAASYLNVWSALGFDNGVELGLGARYVASQFIAEDNQFSIGGVLTLDASASYTYRQATIRLNARNLTDREYETRGFGAMSVIPAPPFGLYSAIQVEL